MKSTKKDLRIIKLLFVIIWMIIVFLFSNQSGEKSTGTSMGFTNKIITIFVSKTNLKSEEKIELIKRLEPIARKMAHYTLYTLGGILIINFINTYDINKKRKIKISIIIGFLYASIDEIHQYFIEGRSASAFDVGIDTLGVVTGVCTFLFFIKYFNLKKMMKVTIHS